MDEALREYQEGKEEYQSLKAEYKSLTGHSPSGSEASSSSLDLIDVTTTKGLASETHPAPDGLLQQPGNAGACDNLATIQKTDTGERGPQSYLDEADQIYNVLQDVGMTELSADGKLKHPQEIHDLSNTAMNEALNEYQEEKEEYQSLKAKYKSLTGHSPSGSEASSDESLDLIDVTTTAGLASETHPAPDGLLQQPGTAGACGNLATVQMKMDTGERDPQSYLDEADQLYKALQKAGLTEVGLTRRQICCDRRDAHKKTPALMKTQRGDFPLKSQPPLGAKHKSSAEQLVSMFDAGGEKITDMAWTPDRELLVAAGSRLRLYNIRGDEKPLPPNLSGIQGYVGSVAVHTRTQSVAVIAAGRPDSHLYVTSLGAGRRGTRHRELPDWCWCVRFTDGGDLLVGGYMNILIKYNTNDLSQQWQRETKHRAWYITVSQDKIIICGGDQLSVLSEDGQWLSSFPAPSDTHRLAAPRGVCTDSSGNVYVADWEKRTVKMFDPDRRYVRDVVRTDRWPGIIALCDDRYMAVTSVGSYYIQMYDMFSTDTSQRQTQSGQLPTIVMS